MRKTLIEIVCRAADALIHAANDYHGLFPSLIDRATFRMLDELPPEIPGQRRCDRAHRGSNLIHDEPDLYDISGERKWLERALSLAGRLLDAYFDGLPLPRGATTIDWYESQMGPGFLLHGLARTAMLADGACPLEADYTAR